ncbi:MAG: TraB/GumN family protein, partial [Spirochaetaceae bacterium]|nr:TraB/GumN family protein [Spirochaetaceae bacterium]
MRRIFSLFVLFSLCVSGASGQASVWRVSGGGNTVYLAGSIHLLREKDYPLPDVFDAA